MDMQMYTKASNLTSPLGENISTSSFQMFLPNDEVIYNPLLLHCDMKNLGEEAYGLLKKIYTSDNPPIILLTYETSTNTITEVCKYIQDQNLDAYFDNIVSINNPALSFAGNVYGTLYNNLPLDTEEFLDAHFEWGKIENCGNKLAEALGCLFNKPTISINMLGSAQDWDNIQHLLEYMPVIPEYDYHKSIRSTSFTIEDNTCSCCGMRRPPLKFFHKIQGKLCLACEARVKKFGDVNLINFYAASLELKKERARTRAANIRRIVNTASILCPHCGATLNPLDGKLFCSSCKETFFVKRNHIYHEYTILGMSKYKVYDFNGKYINTVSTKELLGGK